MQQLGPGDPAPDFTLPSSSGGNVPFATSGRKVVLYFYPADDTPGCTKKARGFQDAHADIQVAGAVVLGVSKDGMHSHHKFAAKHGLPFPLLSDPETAVIKAYGAYGTKNLYGKIGEGTLRHTFLIDEEGWIAKV